MKNMLYHHTFALCALATIMLVGPANAAQDATLSDGARTFDGSSIMLAQNTEADGNDVVVTIRDGDVEVFLNGERVPADRIKRERGKVIILDDEGKAIEEIQMGPGPGPADGGGAGAGGAAGRERARARAERGAAEGAARDRARQLRERLRDQLEGEGEAPMLTPAEPPKVMIGIYMMSPDEELVYHLEVDPERTTMVGGVHEGLAADKAGLRLFDVITKVEGEAPADPESIRKALADMAPGDEIELTVIQKGKERTVTLALDSFDARRMAEATVKGRVSGPMDMLIPMPEGGDIQFFRSPDGQLPDALQRFPEIREWQRRRGGAGRGEGGAWGGGMAPRIEVLPGPQGGPGMPAQPGAQPNVEDRMDHLNQRLDRLERLLDRIARQLDAEHGTEPQE